MHAVAIEFKGHSPTTLAAQGSAALQAARLYKEGGKTGLVGWGVSEKLLSRKLADQARLPTPRYRIGMRVYECGFPRTPSFYGILL